ncbi:Stk1 family PASTA domain-containing Ser/Thr kinase [Rothia halotolerans]|uniref:Stk1 family PASTA domain-containing Ser/Thr kinase n=1 Tax=Rothia halotolerans TaxID=405770 RepID=UPI00101C98A2|nr:Stk1 family PASTA domain-containing Ser/Thr kinase [Rothia halotolerans]
MNQRIPRILENRYELGELIGSGGMATVYAAQDTRLGRGVAIKVLRPEHAQNSVFRARFQREAEAVASLNHPSIVAVYDTGTFTPVDEDAADSEATVPLGLLEAPEGDAESTRPLPTTPRAELIPFIVMELLTGRTLKDVLAEGELPIETAAAYAEGLLDALEYSHEHGVVHRDIKPANIMVPDREEDPEAGPLVKVMDFGIARALTETATPLTEAQTVMGTARYIPPEQARGETVDARSDLYAAGCILYQMLAGRPPFDGATSLEVAEQHLREIPEPPSRHRQAVSPALDSVVLRALRKDRHSRFQSAGEFSGALRNALNGISVASDPAGPAITSAGPTTMPAGMAAVPAADRPAQPGEAVQPSDEGTRPLTYEEYDPSARRSPEAEEADVAGFFPSAQDEYDEAELYASERNVALAARRRRRTAWIFAILGTIIFLLLAATAGAWIYYQYELNKPVYASVPQVQSLSQEEAEQSLRNEGFRVSVQEEFSDDVAAGQTIRTDPGSGEELEEGSSVSLVVSDGPASVTLPEDFAGQSEAYVRSQLTDLGLVPGTVTTVDSPSIQAGMVVGTEPAIGEPVASGETVNLVLSTGKVTVPDITGMDRDAAIAALTAEETQLTTQIVTEPSSEEAPGTVLRQSAAPGSSIAQGSTVTMTVAESPRATSSAAPTPSAEPTPSSEPSASPSPSRSSTPSPSRSSASPSASGRD